ncbi:hypothetical protein VPH35_126220 [Triticum aestivum]
MWSSPPRRQWRPAPPPSPTWARWSGLGETALASMLLRSGTPSPASSPSITSTSRWCRITQRILRPLHPPASLRHRHRLAWSLQPWRPGHPRRQVEAGGQRRPGGGVLPRPSPHRKPVARCVVQRGGDTGARPGHVSALLRRRHRAERGLLLPQPLGMSANPSAIPKVLRLTTTGNQPAGYSSGPSVVVGRRGFKRRVLVHLDLVEDFTPDINGNIPRRPRSSHPLSITLGVIDGESRARDRSEVAVRRQEDDQDRDRHDDDRDRGRRGRDDRPSSWRDHFFRSRSRAPERRDDLGRRNSKLVQRLPDGAVIPASSRRGRRRPDDCLERHGRPGGVASPVCEDSRGRSLPPPSPRTTSCDVVQLSSSSGEATWRCWIAPCFGSSPRPVCPVSPLSASTSPHSTRLDVIEIVPASSPAAQDDEATATPTRAPSVCSEPEPATPFTKTESNTPVHVPAPEPQICTPLFAACQPPLLAAPKSPSPRPRPPTKRRKTLAGVVGFNLTRSSLHLEDKHRKLPIAKLSEKMLCQRMGIIDEGQQVNEEAIDKFVAMFQGQLPDITMSALRALFNLDCDLANAVEAALLEHGGQAGTKLQGTSVDVASEAA